MHISGKFTDFTKADIEVKKTNIQESKADIDVKIANIKNTIKSKTKDHILKLHNECVISEFFRRLEVERITGLKSTRASELIKLMLDNDIIEPVQGHGKGKYRFK
ncbi:MAG: hypothetical protein SOZ97_14970 [Lachnospiraceae bacterium]|nr:hypothetical protein [Lachnospiraceae bacterium]